jgi:flagellar biosynthesis/type III secretory pathway protein FliH
LRKEFRREPHSFDEEQHMPYLTSIERLALEEGRQEGREEGRQEGREEGAREELLEMIRSVLKKRYGMQGTRLMRKVQAVGELPRLRALAQALIDADSLPACRELLEG